MLTKLILILALNSFYGCAEAEWRLVVPSPEKQTWRFCDKSKDGDLDRKGFCYKPKECKKKVWPFKAKCRAVQWFCPWGDLKCMDSHGLWRKTIR